MLTEGKAQIANRQKLILLADHLDLGWEVVKKYQADELASGSEDEKKMQKVEKAAEREAEEKLAARRRARAARRSVPYIQTRGTGTSQSASWSDPRPPYVQYSPGSYSGGSNAKPAGPLIGPCHNCHEYGHLKFQCKKPKKYPFIPVSTDRESAREVFDTLDMIVTIWCCTRLVKGIALM